MNTIKIYLAESGRIADVHKDFPLYKGQFNDKLLNVYVPTSILAPSFSIQHYIGQMQGLVLPTDLLLAEFIAENTYPSREPLDGDIIEFVKVQDNEPQEYYVYIYNNNEWSSEQVETFGTFNNIAGTSVLIGMLATKRNGLIYESKNYYMRYLKTLTYQNVEYALYERKLPKEFTSFVGQGENAPILVMNVVNVDLQTRDTLSIITSQSAHFDVMQSTMLDEDEPIEASTEQEFRAELDILNAEMPNKQDKESENLTTTSHLIVGAINEINAKALNNASDIDALELQVGTNTGDIADIKAEQITQNTDIGANADNIVSLQNRVSTLEQTAITGETPIGTMEGSTLPTTQELTDFVVDEAGRQPQSGDYIYFVLQIAGGTDKNYKYFYGVNGWNGAEIPPMERADNSTYGIVKGSYESGTTTKTQVNISGGEIEDIYVVDNTNTKRKLAEYLNTSASNISTNTQNISSNTQNISSQGNRLTTAEGNITNIISGSQTVGKAISAENDSLDRNIANTYMTQNAGATKQQLYDYALPRTFNDVSFVGADNKYVSTIPTGVDPLYTATSSSIGDTQLFYVEKTISNVEFELSNKNSYTTTLYITASIDCSVAFRVTTSIFTNGNWVTCNTELTDPVNMIGGTIKKINFGSPFNSLQEILNVENGDIIKQVFEVQTDTSTSITFDVYSNETYPSTFYLNTTAQTIIVAQGGIGELPYFNLYGTLSDNKIDFAIDNAINIDTNVMAVFKLNYTETIPTGTEITLSYGGTNIRILTPYNYTTNTNATIDDLSQIYKNSTGLLFSGLFKVIGGDLYVIANIDDLTLLKEEIDSKVTGNTAITGGTKTKITYDSKGLVTAGADLEASDIPNLTLSKITDITATATELNYVDGVTSSIQEQLNSKQASLSSTQMEAVNSGANSTNISQISTNTSDIATINGKIPSQASSSNQLADKDFVNSSINALAAYYITKNANGDPFATKAELTSATTFYSGGVVRVPTTNDYAIVLADESQTPLTPGVYPTTRYSYQGSQWEYQYTINDTPLTSAQLQALNSGITTSLVTQIGTNETNITNLGTTKQNVINSSNKLNADYVEDGTTNKVFTATEKTKLSGIESGAEVNDLEGVQINGTDLSISGKKVNIVTNTAYNATSNKIATMSDIPTQASDINAQETLVSGTNIKTINNQSILGSGNLTIQAGQQVDVQINGDSIISNNVANILTNSTYNTATNKIATMNDISTKVDASHYNSQTDYTTEITNDDNGLMLTSYDGTDISQSTQGTSVGVSGASVMALSGGSNGEVAQILADYNSGVNLTATDGTDQSVIDITSSGVSITGTSVTVNNKTIATTDDIPTNYVTTDTAQTISGVKTFAGVKNTGAYQIGSNDKNVASISGTQITLGDSSTTTKIAGSGTRPTYNNGDIALYSDLPPTITITTTSGSQSVSDGTNTLSFGANAFNSTTIPTSYVSSVNGSTGAVTVAKTDLSNVTYPANTAGSTTTGAGDRVIETYISSDGKTWYRKWVSGWKECGMFLTGSWGQHTVTLPISFTGTRTYTPVITWQGNGTGDITIYQSGIMNTITNNSVVTWYAGENDFAKYLYCSGY